MFNLKTNKMTQEKQILTDLLSKCADKKWFIQIAVGGRYAIAQNFYVDKNDIQRIRINGSFKDFEEMKEFLKNKIDKGESF
jgi:hypothetical protein